MKFDKYPKKRLSCCTIKLHRFVFSIVVIDGYIEFFLQPGEGFFLPIPSEPRNQGPLSSSSLFSPSDRTHFIHHVVTPTTPEESLSLNFSLLY